MGRRCPRGLRAPLDARGGGPPPRAGRRQAEVPGLSRGGTGATAGSGALGPYSALLFDLDGVLCDSRADVERQWRRWARCHCIEWDRLRAQMHGRRSVDLIARVAPRLDAAAEAVAIEWAQATDTSGTTAAPGAPELVASLPAGRWAVVTSGTRALASARLGAAGIAAPEVLVGAEDVAEGKPSPQGYLLAAERLGVAPGECLVIEDAPAGIEAGAAAGATVLALGTTHGADELDRADVVLPDLTHLALAAEVPLDRLSLQVI